MTTGQPTSRLYLIAPPPVAGDNLAVALDEALAAADVAAVLLRQGDGAERDVLNAIKTVGKIVQPRDVALILDDRAELVARAGADGAHLPDIAAFQSAALSLKPERIAGVGGLASRHDAMLAAEGDADYVMFGEPDGDGERPALDAIVERVSWWAEVFQVPCVAYAASIDEVGPLAAAGADFIALDPAIWLAQPRLALAEVATRLRQTEPAV